MGRPSVYPTGTTIYLPERCCSGYTLFHGPGKGAILISMNGEAIRCWKDFQGMPNKMIRGGRIFGSLGRRDCHAAYQDYTDLTEADWDGHVLWSFDHHQQVHDPGLPPRYAARQHHDYQLEGNPVGYPVPGQETADDFSRILLLTHEDACLPEISDQLLIDDVLLEIDRSGTILWQWHLKDHLPEFHLSREAWDAIRSHPNVQDASGEGDFFHTNCVSLLGPNRHYDAGDLRFDPRNLICASRETSLMYIIERETGRIAWQISPEQDEVDGMLIGLHHAHMIPRGLPGEGNILVFDNGGWSGYGRPTALSKDGTKIYRRDWSRVIEFDPVTMEVKWEFGPEHLGASSSFHRSHFYSPIVSSVQRLANGNTLITEGTEGRIMEVTPDHELVWEYLYPYVGDDIVYRAYRIPYDWIPQRSAPQEAAVTPPRNEDFHLPNAMATDPDAASVTVEGTLGYVDEGSFRVK